MRYRGSVVVVNVALMVCLVASQAWGEVYAYPKKGQSQQQFEQDQFGCHNWAKGQTGVDPTQASAAPPPQTGGAVRGGARGAAVGAVGGAIGGNAGKGAAIGAAVGATGGLLRQSSQNQQAAQAQQQAQAGRSAYDRAYASCMEGRGYQVR